jgi:hypothetical protein
MRIVINAVKLLFVGTLVVGKRFLFKMELK